MDKEKTGTIRVVSPKYYGIMFEEEQDTWYNVPEELWNEDHEISPELKGSKVKIVLSDKGTRKFTDLEVLSKSAQTSSPTSNQTNTSMSNVDWDAKEKRIIRQNCLKHATEVLKLLCDGSPDLNTKGANELVVISCEIADSFISYVYDGKPTLKDR